MLTVTAHVETYRHSVCGPFTAARPSEMATAAGTSRFQKTNPPNRDRRVIPHYAKQNSHTSTTPEKARAPASACVRNRPDAHRIDMRKRPTVFCPGSGTAARPPWRPLHARRRRYQATMPGRDNARQKNDAAKSGRCDERARAKSNDSARADAQCTNV